MTHDQKRPCRRTCTADQLQKPLRRRLVDAVVELDRRRDPESGLHKLPRLARPAGGRAQNLVRHVPGGTQPAPHDGRIPPPAAAQRPFAIRDIGPGRLGMPQQHQLPVHVSWHDHGRLGQGRGLVRAGWKSACRCFDDTASPARLSRPGTSSRPAAADRRAPAWPARWPHPHRGLPGKPVAPAQPGRRTADATRTRRRAPRAGSVLTVTAPSAIGVGRGFVRPDSAAGCPRGA